MALTTVTMDLPTSREIELETLLRERDAQAADLTDEVRYLRQYLAVQPPTSTTDPTSLPPAFVSLLLPHIKDNAPSDSSASSTVNAALTQRVKVLQQENDELYELLRTGETGRLKEDVRSLRIVVQKLEGALKESHQTVSSLSEELEKSQAALVQQSNRQNAYSNARVHSRSPALRTNHLPQHSNSTNGSSKTLPTGPRAHKKPRLSEPQMSIPSSSQSKGNRSPSNSTKRDDSRERSPRERKIPRHDREDRAASPARSPLRNREPDRERERNRDGHHDRERPRERERDRGRERERERDKDRERVRGRDHDKSSKRNGAYGTSSGASGGGGGGRRGRRDSNSNHAAIDRTLAERMGL